MSDVKVYQKLFPYLNRSYECFQNGVLTSLPFLSMWLVNFLYSYIADMLIKKNILSVTNARKLANSFGNYLFI